LQKGEAIMVLGEWPFYANIPVKDLQEARNFYENTLGATLVREEEDYFQYQTGDSLFGLYPNQDAAGSALHTLGSFMVEDFRGGGHTLYVQLAYLESRYLRFGVMEPASC
jgi:catechol 2,3-dioxygenase-like lactoylglutathione lyase family enzyme